MKLTYAELSSPGPRPINEDAVGFWEDTVEDESLTHGAVAVVADGVGYPSAEAMKAELDRPETVTITNRAARLRRPAQWKPGWQTLRFILFTSSVCAAAPLPSSYSSGCSRVVRTRTSA